MWQGMPGTWTNLRDWTYECTFTSLKVCSLKVRMSETWHSVTKDAACAGMCTFLEWSSCLGAEDEDWEGAVLEFDLEKSRIGQAGGTVHTKAQKQILISGNGVSFIWSEYMIKEGPGPWGETKYATLKSKVITRGPEEQIQVLRKISPASKEWVHLNWPRVKDTSRDVLPSLCSDSMSF